jgi:hypothetical protein
MPAKKFTRKKDLGLKKFWQKIFTEKSPVLHPRDYTSSLIYNPSQGI